MKYGLTTHQLNLIFAAIKKFPEIEKVILFGSRAMGNYKPSSDIDLMIVGSLLTAQTITRLSGHLNEEVSLPFRFDIVGEPVATDLKTHIQEHGIVFLDTED